MKITSILLLGATIAAHGLLAQGPPAGSGYKLAFSDEFNGSALDETKWEYRTDSKLLSTQTPKNVTVENGNLVIALRKQSAAGKDYTGGGIITRKTFLYGYYEARFKLEVGSGWHSSFWMMRYNGADTSGDQRTLELDVVENQSYDLSSYRVTTHRWSPPHIAVGGTKVDTPDLSKNYHIFGCDYAPDLIRYYLDGKLVKTVDWKGMPQGDVNIWLTSIAEAMGPAHGVDDSALPGKMLVDWVRFYSK